MKTKTFKEHILSFYRCLKKRWYITIFFPIVDMIASFLGIIGKNIHDYSLFKPLFNGNNELKTTPQIIISIILIASIILLLIKTIGDIWTLKSEELQNKVFYNLCNLELDIRKQLNDEYCNIIFNKKEYCNYYNNTIVQSIYPAPFKNQQSRLNSIKQIEEIIKNSHTFICNRLGIKDPNSLSIILYGKNSSKEKWKSVYNKNPIIKDKSINNLINNKKSVYLSVLESPGSHRFFLNKNNISSQYDNIISKNEKKDGSIGSIYIKDLSIYDYNNKAIKSFILIIETKKVQFCNNDEFSKNLCKRIFVEIESMLTKELVRFCLMEYIGLGDKL